MKIAIFAREIGDLWIERFISILNKLEMRGAHLLYYKPFYTKIYKNFGALLPKGSFFSDHNELSSDTDFFLCFGGDGTLLESLTLIRDKEIPVAGINFGRLGFLTSTSSTDGDEWIELLFNSSYSIEKRRVLSLHSPFLPDDFCKFAFNEISFQRSDPFMLSVHVKVNGLSLPPYWSDGLVLATPTGSTAYSMSVGGPIALPGVKAFILAPIAPHNLNVRPLLVPDDFTIEIFVESRKGEAIMSLDNRSTTLLDNQIVTITKADFELNYLSFSREGFIGALKEKLMWGEDKRNN